MLVTFLRDCWLSGQMTYRSFICLTLLLLASLGIAGAGQLKLPLAARDSDFRDATQEQIKLGQLLFYDRVLSGTYRVSCATCHHHDRASSNGFLLDGAEEPEQDDLAINGLPLYEALKPSARHAPTLFNMGAKQFTHLFSDGRVAFENGEFKTPSKELPHGLNDVLAAQSLFPAVTKDELVGTVENDVAAAADEGDSAIWETLLDRIKDLPDYEPLFLAAYPKLNSKDDISIAHIANAISAFVGYEWRADQSPFDAYLRGDKSALSNSAKRGMELFYGPAGCGTCHSGTFQTDHKFHVVGMPPWRFDSVLDAPETTHFDDRLGRIEVTEKKQDAFAFRTPSLRNVTKTAPYGYSGSFEKLEDALRHHIAPKAGLDGFVRKHAGRGPHLPKAQQEHLSKLKAAIPTEDRRLSKEQLSDLIAFLDSLTDEAALAGRLGKPEEVPSSLALD